MEAVVAICRVTGSKRRPGRSNETEPKLLLIQSGYKIRTVSNFWTQGRELNSYWKRQTDVAFNPPLEAIV